MRDSRGTGAPLVGTHPRWYRTAPEPVPGDGAAEDSGLALRYPSSAKMSAIHRAGESRPRSVGTRAGPKHAPGAGHTEGRHRGIAGCNRRPLAADEPRIRGAFSTESG